MGGATTVAELEAKLAEAGPRSRPKRQKRPHPSRMFRRRPPTRPVRPSRRRRPIRRVLGRKVRRGERSDGKIRSRQAAAAKVLTQEAVTEALGADVPPREAAERVTFATWAIVTGKSPGGIFNELPAVDDETAGKIAPGSPNAPRAPSPSRTSAPPPRPSRNWPRRGARVPRGRRARRLRADPGPAPKEGSNSTCRCSCSTRAGGSTVVLRAAAQAPARGHPRVRAGAGRGLDRGAGRRVRAQADGDQRQGSLHPGRLVAGRALAYACAVGKRAAATSASSV